MDPTGAFGKQPNTTGHICIVSVVCSPESMMHLIAIARTIVSVTTHSQALQFSPQTGAVGGNRDRSSHSITKPN